MHTTQWWIADTKKKLQVPQQILVKGNEYKELNINCKMTDC